MSEQVVEIVKRIKVKVKKYKDLRKEIIKEFYRAVRRDKKQCYNEIYKHIEYGI